MDFHFDNTYARDLEGFYTRGEAEKAPAPQMVRLNRELALELNLDADALGSELGAQIFSGNQPPEGAEVLAQAYAGHQFGGFVPQLGDGRAVLLGEVIDRNGNRRDIQLKGSGRTPFSRGGDGKAALGPVLREYIIGEAMYALGVPTTRALAAVTTGQPVFREGMLPGAVLTRIASSHIRVGTFQFFAARRDEAKVKQLADYTIERHYPQLTNEPNPYLAFLKAVVDKQASLIAKWMQFGFIHGVMNTDNMAVSGETIDYGPCAFMDSYSPHSVFSSIDRQGRYAYGQQPWIARWNLARLAESLLPLVEGEAALEVVNGFTDLYDAYWLEAMRAKLGLIDDPNPQDLDIANAFLALLEPAHVDFTLAFRALTKAAAGDPTEIQGLVGEPFNAWATGWQPRIKDPIASVKRMNEANPVYIARNHKVEEALAAATESKNFAPFEALLAVLAQPFTERPGLEPYTQPAPADSAPYRTYCGT